MRIDFECPDYKHWYVVFPDYVGEQEDLEMVEGADEMIDTLSIDMKTLSLEVSEEEPTVGEYFILEMEAHDDEGAFYNVIDCPEYNGTIWLCNVTHEFFGDHPEKLYCQIIE